MRKKIIPPFRVAKNHVRLTVFLRYGYDRLPLYTVPVPVQYAYIYIYIYISDII
jgi:hypothetical protein